MKEDAGKIRFRSFVSLEKTYPLSVRFLMVAFSFMTIVFTTRYQSNREYYIDFHLESNLIDVPKSLDYIVDPSTFFKNVADRLKDTTLPIKHHELSKEENELLEYIKKSNTYIDLISYDEQIETIYNQMLSEKIKNYKLAIIENGHALHSTFEVAGGFFAGILQSTVGATYTAIIGSVAFLIHLLLVSGVCCRLNNFLMSIASILGGSSINIIAFPYYELIQIIPGYDSFINSTCLGAQFLAPLTLLLIQNVKCIKKSLLFRHFIYLLPLILAGHCFIIYICESIKHRKAELGGNSDTFKFSFMDLIKEFTNHKLISFIVWYSALSGLIYVYSIHSSNVNGYNMGFFYCNTSYIQIPTALAIMLTDKLFSMNMMILMISLTMILSPLTIILGNIPLFQIATIFQHVFIVLLIGLKIRFLSEECSEKNVMFLSGITNLYGAISIYIAAFNARALSYQVSISYQVITTLFASILLAFFKLKKPTTKKSVENANEEKENKNLEEARLLDNIA